MRLRTVPFCKEAYDNAMRRMGPVPDRPSAVWLDAYRDRYRWLYRCELLRLSVRRLVRLRAAERAEHEAWCAWQDAGGHTNTLKWVAYEEAAAKVAAFRGEAVL